ncbi:FABP family protein [Mycetocola tolaasinivorans]|uniref:Peroxynitrite isomerase n=1 Tax=Mycetocola tolaasinivorans TaxID=76635 RepID=A0A3L7AAQ0_9MICO|nr:FABP family protein [Mycetocola tolaasinivorans]RLP77383.1 FABP family protein [Mycetocola tolaasinivorans]
MIEIPTGLPAEVVPLSWLLGVWEGTGVLSYLVGEERIQHEFRQRVSFSHDGQSYLNYSSQAWLLDESADSEEDAATTLLASETGYWRLHRALTPGDAGPAMLPARAEAPFTDAEGVETLRNAAGGFDIQASIIHPDGVSELYLGQITGPRIDLSTDAVLRAAGSKDYTAATRMYGLVDGHLLWAWDIAALGQELASHASARLAKVD